MSTTLGWNGARARLRAAGWTMDPLAIPGLVFVCALLAFGAATSHAFLSPFNVSNVLVQVTPLILIALGQALVIGSGGFDLSVGSVVSLSAVITASLLKPAGVTLALLAALLAGLLVGLVNGLLAAAGLEPFLATLATLSAVQGAALIIRPTPGGVVPESFAAIAGNVGNVPVALPGVLLVSLGVRQLLRVTRTGANTIAVGGGQDVAQLLGVNVRRTLVKTYMLSAGLSVLAGVFLVARTRTGDPTIGARFALDSIAAVIVGGTLLTGGRLTVIGTLIGSLALGLIPNVMNLAHISTFYQTATKGLVLVVAILVPNVVSTLLGRRRRRAQARAATAAAPPASSRRPAVKTRA